MFEGGDPYNWGDFYATQLTEHQTPFGPIQHLVIRRHDGQPIHADWDTLQAIKNDILGADTLAVEIFPPDSRVIDEANWRHLWTLPASLPFGLHPLDKKQPGLIDSQTGPPSSLP